MELLFLSEADVRGLLDFGELLDALAQGFRAISDESAVAPARNQVTVPNGGFLLAMPAWQPSENMTVKLVTVFHDNVARGIPGHQALLCAFDPETGTPVAVLDGTYITACRTAGGAALSTRLLARKDAATLAIIGAGVQGRSHLQIVPRVRNFRDVRLASLQLEDAQALAALHPGARAVASHEEAVRGADVVCLCTNAGTPVIERGWLAPGAHVTSVGYYPPQGELPRAVAESGKLFVETRRAFEAPPVGCAELAGLAPERGTELGEVLLGRRPGRASDQELTVYKSMGHAVEDMVAANLVYRKAVERGVGRRVEL